MEALFWRAAGPLIGDNEPSAVLLARDDDVRC